MTTDEIQPGNTDIIPTVKVGKIHLLNFMSTVQVVHQVSEWRREVIAEIPKPYAPQTRAWWAKRIAEETAEYIQRYNR